LKRQVGDLESFCTSLMLGVFDIGSRDVGMRKNLTRTRARAVS